MKDTLRFWFSPHGRIGRVSWWLGDFVANIVAVWSLTIALAMLGTGLGSGDTMLTLFGVVSVLISPAAFWSHIALSVKRLHDTDRSGWTLLLMLVPFIGGLILLCMLGFNAGTQGSNHYGRPPGATDYERNNND